MGISLKREHLRRYKDVALRRYLNSILFLAAAAGGMALSVSILMQDVRSRRMKALKR